MTYLKVVVYDPLNFPGYKNYYLISEIYEGDWLENFRKFQPEPPRGMAWDREQRVKHAIWKQSFLDWLRQQPGIKPLKYKTL